jgi:hypothetical protein
MGSMGRLSDWRTWAALAVAAALGAAHDSVIFVALGVPDGGPTETPVNDPEDCPPCEIPCRDNEGEPCGTDSNGGGCRSDRFADIACGAVICGTAWAEGGTRDTDWYRVAAASGGITASLTSQLPAVVFIVDGIAICLPAIIGETGSSSKCGDGPDAAARVRAGSYAVFVATGNADGSGIFDGGGVNTYQLTVSCASLCPADTNVDGVVDVEDLVNVITSWNTANPAADVDDDGVVGVEDLVAVILAWGLCPE